MKAAEIRVTFWDTLYIVENFKLSISLSQSKCSKALQAGPTDMHSLSCDLKWMSMFVLNLKCTYYVMLLILTSINVGDELKLDVIVRIAIRTIFTSLFFKSHNTNVLLTEYVFVDKTVP